MKTGSIKLAGREWLIWWFALIMLLKVAVQSLTVLVGLPEDAELFIATDQGRVACLGFALVFTCIMLSSLIMAIAVAVDMVNGRPLIVTRS